MSQSARAQEPSMEEILASIRRIIADDTSDTAKPVAAAPAPAPKVPPAPPAPPPAAPTKAMSQDDIDAMLADGAAEEDDEVLDLGEPVQPPRQPAPASNFRQVPANDVTFREDPIPEPELSPINHPVYVEAAAPAVPQERLLSAETNAAVTAAFGTLATTILAENSRSIEDLVRELLRPMLKAWLDDNLPGMVERLVRAEIERVARGGR
jgi:cell pole-organizing protein PopZ